MAGLINGRKTTESLSSKTQLNNWQKSTEVTHHKTIKEVINHRFTRLYLNITTLDQSIQRKVITVIRTRAIISTKTEVNRIKLKRRSKLDQVDKH